jgi:FtsP/CotA-like multicopper oxidase with cupredoxin domain
MTDVGASWIGRALSLALCAGCASSAAPASGDAPDAPELSVAADENEDPAITELTLEAREATKAYANGRTTPVWTYNGSVPGPLIEVAVGDELIVHFKNDLPEATTIHWHGVRLPAVMDGTLRMQDPVQPGASFEYRFPLQDPGLFWFHPHIRSDEQVEKGLYGVLRVRGPGEPGNDHESILVLDDVSVLPDGTLPTYLDDESKMLGRQGNILLVNGQATPTFRWRAGSLELLRIVNVANGRFFNLALPGYKWRVIGTDGGLVPQPYDIDTLLISPGERYDAMVIVTGNPGDETTLLNEPYERGHDTGKDEPMPVATFQVTDEQPLSARMLPSSFPEIERLDDGPADHELELNEGLQGEDLVFTINGATFPDVPLITVPAGSIRIFDVKNSSEMDHPFHLHGTFFQVLSTNGEAAPSTLANKDTVIVPQMSTLKLVARFDEPGGWMYHCHILEHAEGGMMGEISVETVP